MIYALMALTLGICLLCPYVEWSVHSNRTIFQTGKDNETSIAVLTLSAALALVVADLARDFLPTTWRGVEFPAWQIPFSTQPPVFLAAPVPAISPPSNLRI